MASWKRMLEVFEMKPAIADNEIDGRDGSIVSGSSRTIAGEIEFRDLTCRLEPIDNPIGSKVCDFGPRHRPADSMGFR
jgi:hypothetical protein